MSAKVVLTVALLSNLILVGCSGKQPEPPPVEPNPPQAVSLHVQHRLPASLTRCLQEGGSDFLVDWDLNPVYLRGNFDQGNRPDYALAIKQENSENQGILLCHAWPGKPKILGAGREFDGKDHFLFDYWEVMQKRSGMVTAKRVPVQIVVDAILVHQPDGDWAVIFWDGESYAISRVVKVE